MSRDWSVIDSLAKRVYKRLNEKIDIHDQYSREVIIDNLLDKLADQLAEKAFQQCWKVDWKTLKGIHEAARSIHERHRPLLDLYQGRPRPDDARTASVAPTPGVTGRRKQDNEKRTTKQIATGTERSVA